MRRRCQLAAYAEERRRKVSVLESESEDEAMQWRRLLEAIPGAESTHCWQPRLQSHRGATASKPMETMGDAMMACAQRLASWELYRFQFRELSPAS